MAEPVPSAETVPEHQDRGLFGLFGKKEEETKQGDHIKPPASTHTQTQTPDAHLYPTNPPHAAVVNQPHAVVNQPHAQGYGHGHAGQFTAAEAEKQQHTGLLGKLHRTKSSSSSSSSSSDEEGGKKKEGGRKKKGLKDKVKEKLPGGHQASSDAHGHGYEGEKRHEGEKKGLVDKIKDKLPGHHDKE